MGYYGILWDTMGYYGILWDYPTICYSIHENSKDNGRPDHSKD